MIPAPVQGFGAGVLTTAVAIGVLGWLGRTVFERWLQKHFQAQIDALKHEQAREIERLKAKISALLDRATKLHQHEFEAVSAAWDHLSRTLGSTSDITAAFQSHSDAGALSAPELEVLLRDSGFEEHEKDEIRKASRFEKTKLYSRIRDRYRYRGAFADWQTFHNYVVSKAIFIEPPLRNLLFAFSQDIHSALIDFRLTLEDPDSYPKNYSEIRAKVDAARAKRDQIESSVSDRLWNAAKLEP